MSSVTTVSALKGSRPEWTPWLTVVEETLRETDAPLWNGFVPGAHQPALTTPLLANATIAIEAAPVRRFLRRLIRAATRSGTSAMATLTSVSDRELDVLALFRASVCQDNATLADMAKSCGADPAAFQAVVALLPVPFLQACNRSWSPLMQPAWVEGYCQVCGAWPAFAEARGIERNRFFRCSRCGSDWHARPLRCPYCGIDDHEALVSLVPDGGGVNAVIDACRSCHGYVKTFTRLQGCAPAAVLLDDLASVHFDVAALEQGYSRPAAAGCAIGVTVSGTPGTRPFFSWNA